MNELMPLLIGLAVFLLLVYVVNRWLHKVPNSENIELLFARNVELHQRLSDLQIERYDLQNRIDVLERKYAEVQRAELAED